MKKPGFGLMRMPLLDKTNDADVDIEQVKRMVDLFIEKGFTYFDTALMYNGFASESVAKTALVDRYPRESFTLATKLHAGFSCHDSASLLDEILIRHPEMEFVQLQINYLDWESEWIQSRACYEVAVKHGKPVIVMEPVKGGTLARVPGEAEKLFRDYDADLSVPSWAIRFAAELEGVITVLSGMSSLEQMEDNLSYMKHFTGFSEEEKGVFNQAREAMNRVPLIPCTTCNYCAKVCPEGIGISGSFTAMNYLTLYGDKAAAGHQAEWLVGGHGKKPANECVECGKCEEACPQHIKIREELKKVAAELL